MISLIDIRFLKPNIIYRNNSKFRLPLNVKERTKGTVYVPIVKTEKDTLKFFTDSMWVMRNIRFYYHEKLFNYKIYNKVIRYRIKDTELRELFEEKLSPILPELKLAINYSIMKGRNYIHDVSFFTKEFFNIEDSRFGMLRVNEYFRLFKEFIPKKIDDTLYNNKCMFIPIDYWINDVKDFSIFNLRKTDNFISLFFHKLKDDPSYFSENFSGWKFFFTYKNQMFFMMPETFDEDTHKEFRKLWNKLRPVKGSEVKDIESFATEEELEEIIEAKNRTKIQEKIDELMKDDELDEEIFNTLIDKTAKKLNVSIRDEDLKEVPDSIVTPLELELEKVNSELNETLPKSKPRIAREIKLINDMKSIKVDDMTIEEIQSRAESNKMDPIELPIDTINESLRKMTFPNFDEAYLKNHYKKDIISMMTNLQYKDKPLYLIDAKVKDASDPLNKVEEYTFTFEDEKGKRHNFSVLLPKFINGRFMKIGGNKKIMVNQIIPLPIMKIAPDTVQIATNYKKTSITRFGQNISPKVVEFYKKMSSLSNSKVKAELGSAKGNRQYITTIEYDELASKYKKIHLPDMVVYLSQSDIRRDMKKMGIGNPDDTSSIIPIAIRNKKEVIYLDSDNNIVIFPKISEQGENIDFMDFLVKEISNHDESFKDIYKSIPRERKYMYSRSLIMNRRVPVVLLLSYLEGLLNLMKRANINYRIVSKEDSPNVPKYTKGKEDVIEFSDAWLIYKMYPLRNTLLMNGFLEVPTKMYDIKQFLTKDVYHEIFDTLFGRSNIGYAFENFQQLFIDPITEEILRDFNLPTDFIDVFLYANALLEDNSYTDEGDMRMHRVRSNEMVTAFLYDVLSKAYETYRLSADKSIPKKFTAKKDAVITKILTSQVTKDYSDLNPLYTIDLMRSTTFKGPAGMNKDRSFNLSKRSFHPSMTGVISQASPISGAIGIARTLTVDAKITSTRGYIDVVDAPEDIKKLSTTNLVSGAEAALPFSITSDEPERVAMSSAQSRHTLACVGSDRNLVYTGFEKALPHLIGDTFVFKAKKDGKVLKIDEKSRLMVLGYDDGTKDVINLEPEIGKNSGSGFFVSNKLEPLVKEGEKFKAGKLIAHNPDFFTVDKRTGDSVFMHGPLARVALVYSSKTFEDSTKISKRLSDKLSSHIVVKKDIVLGPNANISKIVKKMDKVEVNDPLIIFDVSHEDDLVNKFLNLAEDDDTNYDVDEASRNIISSKYNGVIEDIKIYYTAPKEEYSKSIQDLINYYERRNKERLKEISNHVNPNDVDIPLTEVYKVDPGLSGKIKGNKIPKGGILIEIYIKYKDSFGIGDKLAAFIACKAITCDTWEDGKEPYLLSDPEDKIDAYLGVISLGARMTFSAIKTGLINSILIGMKKNVRKMYEEVYGEKI